MNTSATSTTKSLVPSRLEITANAGATSLKTKTTLTVEQAQICCSILNEAIKDNQLTLVNTTISNMKNSFTTAEIAFLARKSQLIAQDQILRKELEGLTNQLTEKETKFQELSKKEIIVNQKYLEMADAQKDKKKRAEILASIVPLQNDLDILTAAYETLSQNPALKKVEAQMKEKQSELALLQSQLTTNEMNWETEKKRLSKEEETYKNQNKEMIKRVEAIKNCCLLINLSAPAASSSSSFSASANARSLQDKFDQNDVEYVQQLLNTQLTGKTHDATKIEAAFTKWKRDLELQVATGEFPEILKDNPAAASLKNKIKNLRAAELQLTTTTKEFDTVITTHVTFLNTLKQAEERRKSSVLPSLNLEVTGIKTYLNSIAEHEKVITELRVDLKNVYQKIITDKETEKNTQKNQVQATINALQVGLKVIQGITLKQAPPQPLNSQAFSSNNCTLLSSIKSTTSPMTGDPTPAAALPEQAVVPASTEVLSGKRPRGRPKKIRTEEISAVANTALQQTLPPSANLNRMSDSETSDTHSANHAAAAILATMPGQKQTPLKRNKRGVDETESSSSSSSAPERGPVQKRLHKKITGPDRSQMKALLNICLPSAASETITFPPGSFEEFLAKIPKEALTLVEIDKYLAKQPQEKLKDIISPSILNGNVINKRAPLHIIAERGNPIVLLAFIKKYTALSLLDLTIKASDNEDVMTFIADNPAMNVVGIEPLMAFLKGKIEKNAFKNPPMHIASYNGFQIIVEALHKIGYNPEEENLDGLTAIHTSVMKDNKNNLIVFQWFLTEYLKSDLQINKIKDFRTRGGWNLSNLAAEGDLLGQVSLLARLKKTNKKGDAFLIKVT